MDKCLGDREVLGSILGFRQAGLSAALPFMVVASVHVVSAQRQTLFFLLGC
jgi:hypothetical protein